MQNWECLLTELQGVSVSVFWNCRSTGHHRYYKHYCWRHCVLHCAIAWKPWTCGRLRSEGDSYPSLLKIYHSCLLIVCADPRCLRENALRKACIFYERATRVILFKGVFPVVNTPGTRQIFLWAFWEEQSYAVRFEWWLTKPKLSRPVVHKVILIMDGSLSLFEVASAMQLLSMEEKTFLWSISQWSYF